MSPITLARPTIAVRDAATGDNDELIAMAAACSMEGDIGVRVTREPDFFQLDRLEGTQCRVGVAEVDGRVAGCVMVALRQAYLHGVERATLYAGDLKVHPAARRSGVADALSEWVRGVSAELAAAQTPLLLTILNGNRAMESRTTGRGLVPRFDRFATVRVFSIPLLFPRSAPDDRFAISSAHASDLEEMADLWRRVAPTRQLAPVLSAESLARWIARAPGLELSDYRVARDARGAIVGFLAWWNQESFKQMQVTRYSPRLRLARAIVNGVARLTGGAALPEVGGSLRYCTALHVCVPAESPDVLRALLRHSYMAMRSARYAFATIGLDVRDPLCAALGGLFAQPTDVNAYVCTPRGAYEGPSLAGRPLHYEIALV